MRTLVVVVAAALAPVAAFGASAQAARAPTVAGYHAAGVMHQNRAAPRAAKPTVAYRNLALPNGQTATVYANGLAEVFSANHQSVQYRMVPPNDIGEPGTAAALPSRAQLQVELAKAPPSRKRHTNSTLTRLAKQRFAASTLGA